MDKQKYEKLLELYADGPKLIWVKGKVVFVRDTHGDFDASKKVFNRYPDHTKVFTGDYVDRGEDSKGNIDFLLEQKLRNPRKVQLLVGNHEAYPILKCYPNDFWENLGSEFKSYADILPNLPLVAIGNGVLAVHGVLPDVENLNEINQIKTGDKKWELSIWGDFSEVGGDFLGRDSHRRPQFGEDYFGKTMRKLGGKLLIRSHQPDVPLEMFDGNCKTIFTSSAYLGRRPSRTIIEADLDKLEFKLREI